MYLGNDHYLFTLYLFFFIMVWVIEVRSCCLSSLCCFEIGCCVARGNLEPPILSPPSPKYWNYRHVCLFSLKLFHILQICFYSTNPTQSLLTFGTVCFRLACDSQFMRPCWTSNYKSSVYSFSNSYWHILPTSDEFDSWKNNMNKGSP